MTGFWMECVGVGLTEDDPACENPNLWKGANLLRFALMEVRDRLSRQNSIKSMLVLGDTMKYLFVLMVLLPISASALESECFGTTSDGYMNNGVKLPASGNNYVGYSSAARLAGRTYVHSSVRDIVVAAYARLEDDMPNKVFKYAETGFKEGGQFKPHKTHRNGLSVDFMVPVVDEMGVSVHLPTNLSNRLGYDIEFNEKGEYGSLTIDYEAMAAHIVALHKEARSNGHELWRVIFDPQLQPYLFETDYAGYLRDNIQFSKRRSWVRHDEHYHVDFDIPCKP